LLLEPFGSKERDSDLGRIQSPASPDEPDIEVESSGSVSKASDGFAIYGDAMLVDFFMERLAKSDDVIMAFEF
jgi:hypothetical protein